jgi:hypothetical protein
MSIEFGRAAGYVFLSSSGHFPYFQTAVQDKSVGNTALEPALLAVFSFSTTADCQAIPMCGDARRYGWCKATPTPVSEPREQETSLVRRDGWVEQRERKGKRRK